MLSLYIEKSFLRCSKEWKRLYELTNSCSPFLHPDAMKIAVKYFYPYYLTRKCRAIFCLFFENDKVRAIIPLLVYKSGKVQLFGDANGFDESGMVYDSESILPKCIELLRDKFKTIEFIKIDERSPLAQYVANPHAPKTINVQISFPKNHEEYLATLSKSVRQNIRTAYNRLKTDGQEIKLINIQGGG